MKSAAIIALMALAASVSSQSQDEALSATFLLFMPSRHLSVRPLSSNLCDFMEDDTEMNTTLHVQLTKDDQNKRTFTSESFFKF